MIWDGKDRGKRVLCCIEVLRDDLAVEDLGKAIRGDEAKTANLPGTGEFGGSLPLVPHKVSAVGEPISLESGSRSARRVHLRMVFTSTLASVTCGILIGLALTFALSNFAAKWAAGNAHAPVLLLEGTLILVLVAGIACLIPALRTANVDPMTVLRCEAARQSSRSAIQSPSHREDPV